MYPRSLRNQRPARIHTRLAAALFGLLWFGFAVAASAQVDPTTFPLGATLVPPAEGGGTVFRVWAPNASTANVPGEFNGWSASGAPMTKDAASGIWSVYVPSAQEGQEYKFLFDGANWRIDPRSRDVVNSIGNSIIADDGSDFPWQADGWQTPDKDRMVIYELHIGTFSGNGDGVANFPATYRDVVEAHLDDLLALGVNMVELMPVHEFPGDQSWGYNPVHFYAPESIYGDPDDLRFLIDTLHQNGIGVILDVVYNHVSSSDNNLWDFDGPENIYFFGNNCMGETPFGPRPKYTSAEVRDFILDNVRFWFEEFRIDGLRVDATQLMRGYCNEMGEGWLLMGDITDAARSVNPRAVLIAEELPNTGAVTTPRSQGGAGYDAQWGDAFNDVFRAELEKIAGGDSPDMNALAFAIADSGFGRPNSEAVKYVESHDEVGNADARLNKIIDPADNFSDKAVGLSKVAGGLALLSPGMPMLFMGQEFLENKQFNDGSGDRIWWGFLDTYSGVRDYYGELGRLRTSRGALRSTSGVQMTHVNNGAGVVAFQRFNLTGDVIFVVANFSATDFPSFLLGVPASGVWFELINSQDAAFNGNGATNGQVTATNAPRDGQPATIDIHLPPHSLAVFSQTAAMEEEPDDNAVQNSWNAYE